MKKIHRMGNRKAAAPFRLNVFPDLRRGFESIFFISSIISLLIVVSADGFELWSNDTGYLDMRISSKWTSLLGKAPGDSTLYPERWNAANLWRFRNEITGRPTSSIAVGLAYEQRIRFMTQVMGNGIEKAIDNSDNFIPYRIISGDESIVTIDDTFEYAHEIDRAYLTFNLGLNELTLGRQALGLGRGVLFSAVDIFAPFSPTEYDREWRRGVDAMRANFPLSSSISLDLIAALGENTESSAFCTRLKGFVGNFDGELIFGRRYEDLVFGIAGSLPVLDAEMHGEFALFETSDADPDGDLFMDGNLQLKAVLGGSYSFDFGSGVMAIMEYHYSDFGLSDIKDLPSLLENAVFSDRVRRGDLSVLGKHAGMMRISYGIGSEYPVSLTWLVSPQDGSGLLMPTINWSYSDEITITAYGYISHGSDPENGNLTSEYGGTPTMGLFQLSFYI